MKLKSKRIIRHIALSILTAGLFSGSVFATSTGATSDSHGTANAHANTALTTPPTITVTLATNSKDAMAYDNTTMAGAEISIAPKVSYTAISILQLEKKDQPSMLTA